MNPSLLVSSLLLAISLSGCQALTPMTHKPSQTYEWTDKDFIKNIKRSSMEGNWKQAYSIVENRYLLGKGLSPVMDIISTHPDILNVGAVELINNQCLHQSDYVKKKRLDGYSYLKTNGINIDLPVEAISTCTDNPVELDTSGNASLAEVEYGDEYGTVFSVQLLNESSQGTSSGSNLGSIVAQAAYIDNSTFGNYKAQNQLAIGLAGAVIGSLMDKKPVVQFRKIYYVRIGDELTKVNITDSTPDLIPEGACVKVVKARTHLYMASFSHCET